MDNQYHTTEYSERKRGRHLTLADRGAIKYLHKLGYSNRAIARELNCSPTTPLATNSDVVQLQEKAIVAEHRNTVQPEDNLNTRRTNHAVADRTKYRPARDLWTGYQNKSANTDGLSTPV